ncbi:MAG: 50S ribosomal protein L30 [Anaerococcus hydrogenalis]|uniref:50S ribosomal protein L30 n=1 Tax=Anaerococcus hydrogenalis TaxID=33029 RepID=UPI0028FF6F94|nr:50S ribosomal protein L30 [Anaerococcus hydrogenalis]MDU2582850.1 50S ribosomal protein L30 [Anaerococcus hydrogenalis]
MAKVEIKLKKSFIGRKDNQIATAKALGLKKIGQTVVREDSSALRGMINKIPFMLEVKELS